MLQRFEKFLKNKDKNINKVNIEYDLYDFNFKTIYTGHQFESLINLFFSSLTKKTQPFLATVCALFNGVLTLVVNNGC